MAFPIFSTLVALWLGGASAVAHECPPTELVSVDTVFTYSLEHAFERDGLTSEERSAAMTLTVEALKKRLDSFPHVSVEASSKDSELRVRIGDLSPKGVESVRALVSQRGHLEMRFLATKIPKDIQTKLNDELDAYLARVPAEKRTRSLDLSHLTEGASYRWIPTSEHLLDDDVGAPSKNRLEPQWRLVEMGSKDALHRDDFEAIDTTQDSQGNMAIGLDMKPSRFDAIEAMTRSRLGESLCIIIDGEIVSMPTIQSPIRDRAVITGGGHGFEEAEAKRLALVTSNPLPYQPKLTTTRDR